MNPDIKPPVSILDPAFRYVPSENTNIALTFQREISKLRGEITSDYEASLHRKGGTMMRLKREM